MKRLLFILSIFSIAFVLSSKSSATPHAVMSDVGMHIGFFYSSLAPHGEWIEVESGTRVWHPCNETKVDKPQRYTQEKRRELIQRHERKQNPMPPPAREAQRQRIEQRRENSQLTQLRKPAQERQSENKSGRRRNE